jgi:hypothetical protein
MRSVLQDCASLTSVVFPSLLGRYATTTTSFAGELAVEVAHPRVARLSST